MSQIHTEPRHESAYSTPRWVKVLGIIGLVLVVVVVVAKGFGGEHGPGRHTPPMEHGAQQP